jgi:hypothetical protein
MPDNESGTAGKEKTKGGESDVTLSKSEVIDILKTLEGMKRKLQALIKDR